MKKLMFITLSLLLLIAATACNPTNGNKGKTSKNGGSVVPGVHGVISTVDKANSKPSEEVKGRILVEGGKSNTTAQYDKAWVTVTQQTVIKIGKEKKEFDFLKEGMEVKVFFEGGVAESYPVQASAKEIVIISTD